MRKINDKNLRRKVQKQLKELHGRVGMNAVGEQAELAMVNGEGLMVNDERLTVNVEGLMGNGERLMVNGER